DHIAKSRQGLAAVTQRSARSDGKAAAVEANENRPLNAILQCRSPDIQGQAVLAHAAGLKVPIDQCRIIAAGISHYLRGELSTLKRVAHPRPGSRLYGRHVAILASRGRTIGNALEGLDAAQVHSLNFAGGCCGDDK